ncbi:glycosyltransferase [candidate division GN15 bacterium]|nr:glycosyltransferase [candidate division GN15 bacterium]
MNVLHLRASNFYGGPERQLHFHARQARGSSYDITISSFLEDGSTPEFIETIAADGIATHVFEITGAYDPKAVKILRTYLTEHEIDILCTHDYRTHVVGLAASRGLATAWVAFSRGWTWENWKVRAYHTLDKAIIRFADHIVAVSGAQKEKLVRIRVPAEKITVAYNSIMPQSFADIPAVDLKARYGFDDNVLVGVSGGRFSAEKGQMFLIEAAHRAIEREPRLRFALFGSGPDLEDARRLVVKLGRENEIRCPGHEKNLIGCLKDAAMLLNPSLSEGLPNIVLEGMALGTPVIATRVGGVPELVEDGRSGLLVPASDINAMVDAMVRLAADSSLQQKMVEQALEAIRERFSFEQQMAVLSDVYERVAPKRAGTGDA